MKKGKIRIFSLILVTLLSLCILSGCGNQSAETKENAPQTQEETLTSAQSKQEEREKKKAEKAAKKEAKKEKKRAAKVQKEVTKATEEKKSALNEQTDEKEAAEEKKAQEEAAKKAEEDAKAKAEAEAKAKAEAEAKAKAEEEARKRAEEEQKQQEPTAPASSGLSCTISISCSTILNNMDQCDDAKKSIVPASGVILSTTTASFSDGETVFDVLKRVCQEKGIHLSFRYTPLYGSYYIEGIANLYEFDVGNESGWMYKVNGWFPNYGCSSYTLEDGDEICWMYTCNGLGADVGGGYAVGG